jgi:hypothetical protein
MAVFTADLTNLVADQVNKSIHQVDEDTWIVDLGSQEDAVVLTLTTAQAVKLGFLSDLDFTDYQEAAWDYLLSVIEQDEMNYVEYYTSVQESMIDLYGDDFDMEAFGSELNQATKELKGYLRSRI